MFKSVVQRRRYVQSHLTIVAVLGVLALFTVLSCGGPRESETRNQNADHVKQKNSSSIDAALPVKVGMTWDECVPFLQTVKRFSLARKNADRFTDTYMIGKAGYNLTFERSSQPEAGPYRLVKIERADINAAKTNSVIDVVQDLKRGLTLNEALPLMQKVGGFFVLETRDRFVAVLEANDTSYRVIFERPKDVTRPDIIANASPEVLSMSGRIPLNGLPEFGEYRITAVKKTH